MDAQKSLFKKFFNSTLNKSSPTSSSPSPSNSAHFNPPKFQFNKRRLGIIDEGEGKKGIDADVKAKVDDPYDDIKAINDISPCNPNTDYNTNNATSSIATPIKNLSNTNIPYKYDIPEKYKQRYNLSNQLNDLSANIETVNWSIQSKFNKIDLLILGLDEKIGEAENYKLDLITS